MVIVIRKRDEPSISVGLGLMREPNSPLTGLFQTAADALATWDLDRKVKVGVFRIEDHGPLARLVD